MASRRAETIGRNYRLRLRALRVEVARQLGIAYAKVTEEDIRASFEAFLPFAARTITAGQASAQTLTRAYIRGVGGFEPLPVPSLAGTSKAGTIADALAGIPPFILGAIAKGASPTDAIKVTGAYFVDRMADNEVTRVVDRELLGQAKAQRVTGWIGTVNGPCDQCAGNDGPHSFDEEMVRHPGCECDRTLQFEEYAVPRIEFVA